jgi:hypothetical protein
MNASGEVRAAWEDVRRVPYVVALGVLAVVWPVSGRPWLPLAIGGAAWLLITLITRPMSWKVRATVRRIAWPLIIAAVLVVLADQSRWWSWTLAVGLVLLVLGLTPTLRARWRETVRVRHELGDALLISPDAFAVESTRWDGRRLVSAIVRFDRKTVPVWEADVRTRITEALSWSVRPATAVVDWPTGIDALKVRLTWPQTTATERAPARPIGSWALAGLGALLVAVGGSVHLIDTTEKAQARQQTEAKAERQEREQHRGQVLPREPRAVLRILHNAVATGQHTAVCLMMDEPTQQKFAESFARKGTPCVTVAAALSRKVKDISRYAWPQLPNDAITRTGDTAVVDGCRATFPGTPTKDTPPVDAGPPIGALNLTRIGGGGYLITGFAPCV